MLSKEEAVRLVIAACKRIQDLSGRAQETMSADTVPLDELEGFDSKNALEAGCLLEEDVVGIDLTDEYLFGSGDLHFTVSQIADRLCKVANGGRNG
jgi:hypothetical protein